MPGAPLASPDQADVVQVRGQTVVQCWRLTVLSVPALHAPPRQDLLDLAVPPLVSPGPPRGPADPVLLPAPGSPRQESPGVSQQAGSLPPRLRPVADVEDGVGEVNLHVHHGAALVLTLVNRQVDLTAAQSPAILLSLSSSSPILSHLS